METLEFKGLHNFQSKCGLQIHNRTDGEVIVILTELPDNPGTSVTNFVGPLATKVFMEKLMMQAIKPENIVWIEHYPERGRVPETWDLVGLMYHEDYKRFQRPQWERIQKEQVDELLAH